MKPSIFSTLAIALAIQVACASASTSSSRTITPSPTTTTLPPGCPTINPAGHQCGGAFHSDNSARILQLTLTLQQAHLMLQGHAASVDTTAALYDPTTLRKVLAPNRRHIKTEPGPPTLPFISVFQVQPVALEHLRPQLRPLIRTQLGLDWVSERQSGVHSPSLRSCRKKGICHRKIRSYCSYGLLIVVIRDIFAFRIFSQRVLRVFRYG